MLKKLIHFFILTILLSSIPTITHASEFLDVPFDHSNFKSISFLKQEGVVKGFEDGTYDPWRQLTRCEFLKIVMEASKIKPTISTTQIFSDLPTTSWCHGYAAKAKQMNVVQGDELGLFWPQRSISRIEALKLLFLLRSEDVGTVDKSSYFDVPATSWYAPYITRATYSNIISGKSPGIFGVSDSINRGEMAEMIYRLLALESNNKAVFNSDLKVPSGYLSSTIEDDNVENNDITSIIEDIVDSPLQIVQNSPSSLNGNISENFYEHIELDNPIPKTFVLNEVYTFTGMITTPSSENVMIVLTDSSTDKQFSYPGTVNSSNSTFEVSIEFNQGGKFSLGILPSLSGSFKVKDIVVVSEKEINNNSKLIEKADNLKTYVNDNGDAVFSWNNKGYELSKIVIEQNNEQVVKIISNGKNSWTPDYLQFQNFEEKDFGWAVFLADSVDGNAYSRNTDWSNASNTISSTAAVHHFMTYESDEIKIDNIKLETEVGKMIKISGNSSVDIKANLAVTMTDGFVEEFPLQTNKSNSGDIVRAPVDFEISMPIYKNGIYFLEINGSGGAALYNAPLYVGGLVPLIPDFKDMEQEIPFVTRNDVDNKLSTLRNEWFNLINVDRVKHGLTAVTMDETLNNFAQSHAEDMAKYKYFSHNDRFGNGPSIRKLNYDIGTPVGENLAKAKSLIAIEAGLMRSPIHRATILRDYWERIGLGIAMGDDDHLVVVQEFSKYPYDQEDVISVRDSIYEYLSTERTKRNLNLLETNTLAQDIALSWSRSMLDEDFFAFISPNTKESLQTNIQDGGFNKSFSSLILSGGDIDTLIENLEDKKNSDGDAIYTDSRWSQVGVGVETSENGTELNATLIFLEI